MRTYQFVIGTTESGLRLDRYLTRHLPVIVSRAMIQRSIRDGKVTVGDRPAKAHQKLHRGNVIVARVDQLGARARKLDMPPQPIPLEVVYEDAEVLVVNKPAGLVTHPAPGHWDGTLVNAVLWHLRQETGDRRQVAEEGTHVPCPMSPVPRAGIVHRLDKDTSGLLLVAKTDAAHAALSRQLKARTIRRRYLALVEGHVPLDGGTVDAPIGRHLTHRKTMTVRHLGGRSAVTRYRVLKRFKVEGSRFQVADRPLEPRTLNLEPRAWLYSLLEVSLETGRTHQIRVHMAHLGHPVLGDPVYGRRPSSYWAGRGILRQLLHAYAIRFVHPTTHAPVELSASVPEDMARWMPGRWREPSR